MRTALLALCLLISSISSYTQPLLSFNSFTDEDGLSNGFVTSIYQDEKGFLWFGTANGLNRFDGYEFKTWMHEEDNPNSLIHNIIWTLYGTSDGAIWIGTDKGLNRFDPKTETFTPYFYQPNNTKTLSHDLITAICEDKEGNLWIGTGNGLSLLQKGTDQFLRYFYDSDSSEGKSVRCILRDEKDYMWFGLMDTLFCFNPLTKNFQRYPLPFSKDRPANFAKVILLDGKDHLWISTDINGIYLFDKKAHKFIDHFKHNPKNNSSLSHDRISSFLKDDYGNLWIGSYGGGLNFMYSDDTVIHRFQPDPFNSNHKNFEVVRNMLQDNAGNIWLGTFYGGVKVSLKHKKAFINYFPIPSKLGSIGGTQIGILSERADGSIWVPLDGWGLALFDPKTETFKQFTPTNSKEGDLVNKNVLSVLEDANGDLWVITFNEIWKMDGRTKKWLKLQPSGMPNEDVWFTTQFKDTKDAHWIGSQGGLFQYDRASNALIRQYLDKGKEGIKHGDNNYVESFFESKNGDLWIATHGGVHRRPAGSKHFQFYPFHQQILCVHQDKSGTVWLGTINGLTFFNAKEKKVAFHPKAKSIEGKLIHSILEDNDGRLWMGSREGLICFDPATGNFREYNQKDGVVNRQFFNSYLKSKTGEFYFGGNKGLVRFHPDSIYENPFIPPIVLTNFQLLNKDVPIRGSIGDTLKWKSPLLKNITYTETIILQYWQNDFAFEFAALDFTAPMNNHYRYMFEGYDTSWVETSASRRFARYTNLNPGKYVFKVRGSNNDGKENEEGVSVHIRIHPPWWRTWWAYILWSGLILSILFFIRWYELRRRLASAEARRLKDIDALKSKLYTNITHEFRTPLTVILGIAEYLQTKVEEDVKSSLELIRRNGRQLLNLVNQMLDLSKVESGAMKLKMIQGDVLNYLRYLAESFHSLAESKKIRLHFFTELSELNMDFEPLRLQQIVSNLLSNAFKFTPEGGNVYFFADKNGTQLEIRIRDTGIGIPEEKQPFIFDRFVQADDSTTRQSEGTGIGLALTKELVLLMKGEISVSSKPGEGAEFTVLLPITHTGEKQAVVLPESILLEEGSSLLPSTALIQNQDTQAPLLLLVEDNHDVVKYLLTCLNTEYRIEIAYNGQQGIEKALELIPDLIISDVMMPQKDGFELCHKLKTDERSSHIPIILLTAKADIESKLSGLRRGADAYLAKPFHKEELLTQIYNLLEIRRKLQTYYLAQAGLKTTAAAEAIPTDKTPLENALEHAFIQKVKTLLEEDFSKQWEVPELAKHLHVSTSQLYRKLEALTGMHTTEFVRYVRLLHAQQLLLDLPEEAIATIGYKVGFSNPPEFTRRFKEVFQMTPGEWRKHKK